MVYAHQDTYYRTLRQADQANNSTVFVEFMLDIIAKTIHGYLAHDMSDKVSDKMSDNSLYPLLSASEQQIFEQIYLYLLNHHHINNSKAQALLNKSPATVRRYLSNFVNKGLLMALGNHKSRIYTLAPSNKSP